jgi:hypothetical protein
VTHGGEYTEGPSPNDPEPGLGSWYGKCPVTRLHVQLGVGPLSRRGSPSGERRVRILAPFRIAELERGTRESYRAHRVEFSTSGYVLS